MKKLILLFENVTIHEKKQTIVKIADIHTVMPDLLQIQNNIKNILVFVVKNVLKNEKIQVM
jgi:hypothetical protein